MRLSIVSLGPHYPGSNRVLAGTYPGIYRILCSRRPRTYLGLMRGDVSFKRAGNLPGVSAHARTLTNGAWGYGAGTYVGIYKKNVSRSPGEYPGLYLGCHKVKN